ncbi:hypothetical protein [Sorangium sp. So ce233]|uniref:hypothetical protein n=1 Tax=Sorangium sp. So ce233 TaxID=3133290 RepID=UPI003F646291
MVPSKRWIAAAVIAASSAGLSACFHADPPSAWARGGALMEVAHAQWVLGDSRIEILPNGEVTADGVHLFTIDRAGRVTRGGSSGRGGDEQPYVLLEPSGHLIGPNDASWGFVAVEHAFLPEKATPWVIINPAGYVIHYDDDGRETELDGGRWYGCRVTPRTQQSCTLVTYLIRLEQRMAESHDRRRMDMEMRRMRDRR